MPDPNLSTQALADATEIAGELLEALRLDAYLFEIEPGDAWSLRIECACPGGWQTSVIPLDVDRLLASRDDDGERARLLAAWGERLRACGRTADG